MQFRPGRLSGKTCFIALSLLAVGVAFAPGGLAATASSASASSADQVPPLISYGDTQSVLRTSRWRRP